MTQKELFEMATKVFSVMTPQEQGVVLILFKAKKGDILEAFIDSVHRVVKPTLK